MKVEFIEKLDLEIESTQKSIDAAEAMPNDHTKDLMRIAFEKAYRNGLIRAKKLFEGERCNG